MKLTTKARRAFLLTILAGSTVALTGCSSGGRLASMNPFARATPGVQSGPSLTESIAATSSKVGTAGKSTFTNTSNKIAGMFGRDEDSASQTSDPLSLSQKPDQVAPEVFVANGQLWESTGDFTKAMESYTKALESDANNAPALTSIARLHFRQAKYTEAVQYFQQAIAVSPQDAGLHNDLGLTLSKMGNHAGATQSLTTALSLAPGTSRYANNLATVKFESGDTKSAYQVLSTNNKPAVAHFNMAYLHFKNGQMNEAKGHLAQAVRYEPQGTGDTIVQRAVERSRDMLAQIDGSTAPVAQAAPHATIAGGQFFGAGQRAAVQQTSQSGNSNAYVAPAAPTTTKPATTPPTPTQVKSATPKPAAQKPATLSAGPSPIPGFAMPTVTANGAAPAKAESKPAAAERPMPIRPTEPGKKPAVAPTASNGFTLPK
ncbi:MAG: tetratricopeptide repeat protein [Rubripirellula sp.]